MPTAIYVRVSSKGQKEASQLPELERWAGAADDEVCWYRDCFTGTSMERPAFARLLADAHTGKIGRIVVWRLDRLGRTAVGLHKLLCELRELKIGFVSLRDGLDLETPTGRLVFGILASVAEYETEVRQERQRAGIDAARTAGNGKCGWGGRKAGTRIKVTPEKEQTIRQLALSGTSIAQIARALSLSRPTIYAVLRGKAQL